jgi:hypothetical protein
MEELRKKNEEDAKACGRIVRTISNPGTNKSSGVTTKTAAKEKDEEDVTPAVATEAPSPVPKTSTHPVLAGMILNKDN